jgi:hypothetical protein
LSNQVDRASLRATLTYRLLPRLQAVIEYNPRADDVGLLVNLVAITETKRRPALILGTSSDRIGTLKGRAVYATVSKDISQWTKLAITPYIGVSYSGFEKRLLPIGGLNINFNQALSSLVIFDGVKVHPTLIYTLKNRHVFTFLMAQSRNPGFSYSISF